MEVKHLVHMNGGDGESSYAQNSLLQKKVLGLTKPIRDKAIHDLLSLFPTARRLAVADLGCSSGPNTLQTIRDLTISILENRQRWSGGGQLAALDLQVFLNDLPSNDFNAIFIDLPSFKKELQKETGEGLGRYLIYGVPGSFYDHLFEDQALHFVHSSYNLQILSQVPRGMGRSNKRNILVSSGSPRSVIEAYYHQFQSDFSTFLQCRSKELVNGGCMVLTLLGRKGDGPTSAVDEGGCIWELLGLTLSHMVSEGLIEEEKLELFNIPKYLASPKEIEILVKNEGSFTINYLETSEIDWCATMDGGGKTLANVCVAKFMRAVEESALAYHFGEGLMDEVFKRYGETVGDRMAEERTFFVNVTLSLTKTKI